MAHGLVKVVFVVQLDGRMLRFLLQVKPYYHWRCLASILVECQLLWQVHLLYIVRVRRYYRDSIKIAPVKILSRTDPMQTGLHWATAATSVNLALITGTSQEPELT